MIVSRYSDIAGLDSVTLDFDHLDQCSIPDPMRRQFSDELLLDKEFRRYLTVGASINCAYIATKDIYIDDRTRLMAAKYHQYKISLVSLDVGQLPTTDGSYSRAQVKNDLLGYVNLIFRLYPLYNAVGISASLTRPYPEDNDDVTRTALNLTVDEVRGIMTAYALLRGDSMYPDLVAYNQVATWIYNSISPYVPVDAVWPDID